MPHRPDTIRSRGYLPHWEVKGGTYSVTFRLADSLPKVVLEGYQRERQGILATAQQMRRPLSKSEQTRLDELFSDRIEEFLDQGAGQCLLRNPVTANVVLGALHHFHATRYDLHTWCIMPNHVHVLFTPGTPYALDEILHSWKSFTAKECNRLLHRTGIFWMPEYYDHLIRDAADFFHAHNYILNNPKKAGLAAWPWVGTHLPNDGGRDARVT